MNITLDNLNLIPQNERNLTKSILTDIEDINELLVDKGLKYLQIFLDYQDFHDEYSPERVEPCPDYYHTYTLRFLNNNNIKVGENMPTINDVDNALLILTDFINFIN